MTRNNNYPAPGINPAILDGLRGIHPDHTHRIEVYAAHLRMLKVNGGTRWQINRLLYTQAFVASWWFCREGLAKRSELVKPLLAMEQDLDAPEVSA